MKRIKLLLFICMISLFFAGSVEAKPSNKTVKKAYKAYINKKLSSYYRPNVKYYDINRDGVKECFFIFEAGVRYGARILTYKGGKVYNVIPETRGISSIYYKKSAKKICILTSGGAADNTLTVYKLKGKKLKKTVQYHDYGNYLTGVESYYKNSKLISKNQYINETTPYLYWKRI